MPDHQGFDTDTGLPTALAQTPAAWTVRVLLDNRNFKNFGLKRLVIRNFEEEFEGDWGKVRNKIHELSEVLPLPYLPPPGIRNFIALSIEDPAIKAIESKFPKKKGTDLLANCKALFCLNAPHLEKIGAHAFENCAYLTGTVMKNVKIFEDRAFYFCRRQATTYFPQVQTFGERALAQNHCLKDVNITNTVSIGAYAFLNCTLLDGIFVNDTTKLSDNAFAGCNRHMITILVHDFAKQFNGDWNKVRSRVLRMGHNKKVHLEITDPNVKTMGGKKIKRGKDMFRNCSNLYQVTLHHVEDLEGWVFGNCANLYCINLISTKIVGPYQFSGCKKLERVHLPKATLVKWRAFEHCEILKHVKLTHDVKFKKCAFLGCPLLEILANASKFDIDTGSRDHDGANDPTVGIVSYLKYRCQLDDNPKVCRIILSCLKMCNTFKGEQPQATTDDPIMGFMSGTKKGNDMRDIVKLILLFKVGQAKDDLRTQSKGILLGIALGTGKLLKLDNNIWNLYYWGIYVDDEGKRTTVTRAIETGALHRDNAWKSWGFKVNNETGDMHDKKEILVGTLPL